MIKYTVTMNPNKTIKCIKDDKGNIEEVSESKIAWQLLLLPKNDTEAHESDYKKKHFESINLIVKGKEYNVSFEKKHFNQICKRTAQLQKELRNKIKKVITIATGTTAAVASLGIGAAAVIHLTAEKEYNPVVDSKYTVEQTLENTQAIPVISEEMLNIDNLVEFTDGTTVTLDDAYKVELDNNSLYDPGIEERNAPYKDMIQQRANRWGISYDLLYDVVSQEYGGPEDKTNICHVIFDSWEDQIISAYNNETQRNEYIVLTNNPDKYERINADRSNAGNPNTVDQTISPEELRNPETSLSIACIILQYTSKYYKGNLPLAVQAYNNGVGAVDQIVLKAADATGTTGDKIIEAKDGVYWLRYRNIGQKGDPNYFYNVAKHMSNENQNENIYSIKIDNNGNVIDSVYKVVNSGLLTEQDTTEVVDEEIAKGR